MGSLPNRGISRPRYPAHQRTGPLPPQVRNWFASRPPTRGSNRLKDDRQMRAARLSRLSWLARLGCYAEVMTVTLHLDGAVAEALVR